MASGSIVQDFESRVQKLAMAVRFSTSGAHQVL
jgi:hypothetical protein